MKGNLMSFLGNLANIGCDRNGFVSRPAPPSMGCDTDGFVSKPDLSKYGRNIPDYDANSKNSKTNKLLQSLAIMAAANQANSLNMQQIQPHIPTYVVPPMTVPGVPGGIMM